MVAARRIFAACGTAALLVACGSAQPPIVGAGTTPQTGASTIAPERGDSVGDIKGHSPIKHLIIVIQENRTFDNLFATFPNADGTTTGYAQPMPHLIADSCKADGLPVITQSNTKVTLAMVSLTGKGFPYNFNNPDLPHVYQWQNSGQTWTPWLTDYDNGKMDGFDLEGSGPNGDGAPLCTFPYQYVNPAAISEYWDMAKQYVLADQTYQTQESGSFTAHQDLIAGATILPGSYGGYSQPSVIDNPSYFPWGCNAGKSVVTSLITTDLHYLFFKGPYPCFTYTTMRDLLDAASPPIPWKYYTQDTVGEKGDWNAFDAISSVYNGPEFGSKVVWPNTKIFADLKGSSFPAVSWITPIPGDSDHPSEAVQDGPSWVASIVNAVGKSKYWKSSAIVILWDDWGGFYDHESPPFFNKDKFGGLGFRVPMLVVSPYVKAHVEHTQYEFGSILRFAEENWNLPVGGLGTTDQRATSIGNAFNFKMKPRPFKVIPARLPISFFLRQKQTNVLPDPE
ncbi:MAG TPA: alkaline phosphatase family protein [Candidatus Cybelea sp.]|nr:alkaline phosphatase family protein [Candidatus Cybelea sp.]